MDGTFAVLFLVAGLTDMSANYCQSGCLAQSATQARMAVSAGDVQFQDRSIGSEVYGRYSMNTRFGPFQPAVGFSMTDDYASWLGIGATWSTSFLGDQAYVELHLMPGVYAKGDGPNLGHDLEFRSGIELGYQARNGWRYGISYDHRSNADIASYNPGLETLQFRVSIPVN